MDLKYRFQHNPQPSRPLDGFRNTNSLSRPSLVQRESQSGGGALNRFRKKTESGKAPEGQFKKYMLEANNIFYENRPEVKIKEDLKFCRCALLSIWLFLAISYFMVGRLSPFEGQCPPGARCGVFVHCPDFYQYDGEINSCVLRTAVVEQVELISRSQVEQIQYSYGDLECTGSTEVPHLDLNQMFEDMEDFTKKRHYQQQAREFLQKKENQEQLGFRLQFNKVIPLKKRYTLSCTITKYFSDPHNLLDLLEILSVLVAFAIIGVWFTRRRRVGLMYNFLRDKVMASPDETLNVTHAMADLEVQFGTIDEQTWEKINEVRTNKKEVGYYEDDFLYWKKM